ncbi:Uncharacterised protein [Raoultella terrigena]|uniref:histidine kinase n=1 Tax=Raoultella terrigena TaxID=577 RepID=A0A4U9CS34_RAOTE|nr:Uncharacterised protein [Raoultella terrigena]
MDSDGFVTSLVVSLFFTIKLSSRILTPLNAVASSLKQISQGNLDARASCTRYQLGEMNNLVNDLMKWRKNCRPWMFSGIYGMRPIAHELRTPVTILRGRLSGSG